jgi:hypothetical protein
MTVVMSNMSSDGAKASRDMRESQRALELRKYVPRLVIRFEHPFPRCSWLMYGTRRRFFAPNNIDNTAIENSFNESLKNDGALDAYAETIVWRLRGVHAMVRYVPIISLALISSC